MNVLVLCLFLFEYSFGTPTSVLNLARYTITQNALTVSKNKHNNFTQEISNWLNSRPLPPPYRISWQHNCAYFQFWATSYHFTVDPIKDLNYQIGPNALNTQITAHLSLNGRWKLRDEVYINYLFGHFCLEFWWCNSDWSATVTIIANVSSSVGYDSSKGGHITPVMKIVSHSIDSKHFGEEWCLLVGSFMAALVGITEYFVDLVLTETWNVLWKVFVEGMTVSLQSVHELTMYEGVKLTYWYAGLVAVTSSHIQAQINGTLSTQLLNGKWINFTVDSNEADMFIPKMLPKTNGPIINNGEYSYFLNDLRVTSSILQGIIWAANERNELTPSYNFTALDSTFIFHLLWGYPLIAVPKNGTIEFEMGYGLANGTCYQNISSMTNTSVVLQFNFSDLLAYGTIALEGLLVDSNLTLAFQFNSIDTSHLKPFLIIPQIPLPANVVQNMMILLINNSIALINSWSASHAIQIPYSFLPWISNPVLKVIHQDGCCNGTHGYMDFSSMCVCSSGHSLWPICPPTASCSSSIIKSNLSNNSNHITHSSQRTHNHTTHNTEIIDLTSVSNLYSTYGVWWYIYSSENDKSSCNVENVNDDLIMVQFPNTNGICTKTPISALSQYSTEKYYLLNMTNNYHVNEIRTVCNKTDCTECMYNNTNIDIGHCYGMGNVNTMFQTWTTSSANVCIGGNKQPDKSDIILTAFNNTKTCSDNILITMKNMGPILNKCRTSNNSNGTGMYATLETLNVHNNSYMFKDECVDNQCNNCSIHQQIYMNKCQSYIIKGIPASYRFSFGDEIDRCGDKIHNRVEIRWDIILSILFGSVGVVITIILHIYYFRRTKENYSDPYWVKCFAHCSKCFRFEYKNCLKINCERVANAFKDATVCCLLAVYNSFISPTTTVYHLKTREKCHIFLLLFSCAISVSTYYMWHTQSPWNLFDESSFEFIGVPADSLDITDLTSVLNYWEECCELYFIVFSAIFFISFIARFICVRKPFGCSWPLYQMILLLLYIHLTFLLTLIAIPTFYSFTKSIKLNSDDNNTFTGSSDIQGDVNTLLGYSFTGVFLSFFSNVILYFVYSVPIGIYIVSLIFIRQLFINSDEWIVTDKYSFFSFHKFITGKSTIFYYDMSQEQKTAMIARVVVMLFVIQSMCLCIESLPVIIMYQSFGTSGIWILCWMLKWLMPIILLYFAWKECQIYSWNYNNPVIIRKCQIRITFNGLIAFILFCLASVISIWCEAKHTQIAVWFTISSCVTGFISGAICWIFVLHYMFNAVAVSNSKTNNQIVPTFSLSASHNQHTFRHLQQPFRFDEALLTNPISFTDNNNNKCCKNKCNSKCCCGIWYFLFE
eukprot:295261_1